MRTVLVGVGNELRGDDAVGLRLVELLRPSVPRGVGIFTCDQEPSRLIESFDGADAAVVVDALEPAGAPGAVRRLDASDAALESRSLRSSTHAFGVADTIELARALGRLPRRTVVFGVEGADFTAGFGLSVPVREALGAAAAAILHELEEMTCTSRR